MSQSDYSNMFCSCIRWWCCFFDAAAAAVAEQSFLNKMSFLREISTLIQMLIQTLHYLLIQALPCSLTNTLFNAPRIIKCCWKTQSCLIQAIKSKHHESTRFRYFRSNGLIGWKWERKKTLVTHAIPFEQNKERVLISIKIFWISKHNWNYFSQFFFYLQIYSNSWYSVVVFSSIFLVVSIETD